MDKGVFKGIGRGRGIRCVSKTNPIQPSFNENNEAIKNLNIEDDKENFTHAKESSRINGYEERSHDDENLFIPVPRVNYIPDDDSEDYQLHVNSGINFDGYDSVHVNVTGNDIPREISSIDDFQLPPFLKANIRKSNYKKLTPVQKYTIPIIANGRDIMACAQTGSGKTVAFLVPIIKNISEVKDETPSTRNSPKCLIMVPTRELCRQIFTVALNLCRDSPIKCAYSYGGIEMRTSMLRLQKCDILVSTPGRLVFNLESNLISLDRLRYFVLDEADRMLQNEAFLESIKLVYGRCKSMGVENFHVSMFSATFPNEMQSLGESLMKNHLFVGVGLVGAANSDIKQIVLRVTSANKLDSALEYLTQNDTGKTLIFVRAKRFADFLGIRLIDLKLMATTIHGDRDQSSRETALNDFKSGRVSFLVATDVASRGLDIPSVDTVINVDMPDEIDIYVHRIGRTGRCGNPGSSVSFFDEDKDESLAPRLVNILKDAKQDCPDWLERMCSGYRPSENKNRKDYRKNVESTTFVAGGFMNSADDKDDFFS